ncbi:hypothetical protein [Cupriavidus sp. UYPR2.512]|nr:hypothetical protein [Cupriavidus sp. UYPR2.512]UIF90888.1 hypothetical protein KAF44_32385 [Cupriavidus necator]
MTLLQTLAVLSLLLPAGMSFAAALWFWRQWRAAVGRRVRRAKRARG